MQYTNGNYQAFLKPGQPKKEPPKKAVLVGGDLPSLAAAAFLIRDAHLSPTKITILVSDDNDKGGFEATGGPENGWITRGRQELEEHYETLWDLYRSIPSLVEDGSVLDEIARLNEEDPNTSEVRLTRNRGQRVKNDKKFTLSNRAVRDMVDLMLALPEDLYDRTIKQKMGKDFFRSNFWTHWRTLFGFEQWHSALEMKLYLERFIHLSADMTNMSAWKTTRFDRYHSLILPLQTWLEDQGVRFKKADVMDIGFDIDPLNGKKMATSIAYKGKKKTKTRMLGPRDLLFITVGSLAENTSYGDHHTPAALDKEVREGGAWWLWRKIAVNDPTFGHPDNFCTRTGSSHWQSATLTVTSDRIREQIEKVTGRAPNTGRTVTGGVVSAVDSSWLLSWNVPRQPHFPHQPENQTVVWVYGKNTETRGDYVPKTMGECTGEEMAKEWLYHIGIPQEEIDGLAASGVIGRPLASPFVTSLYLPRDGTDRPKVIPDGALNFAFIGQFTETSRDTIFTPEYSVRSAMEAVYGLAGVRRGVPEVYNSTYDVRQVLRAGAAVRDYRPYSPPKWVIKMLERTEVGLMLVQYGVLAPPPMIPQPKEAVTPPDSVLDRILSW